MSRPVGFVYLFRCNASGYLKVGFSLDVAKRAAQFEDALPLGVSVVSFVTGGRVLEKELHIEFSAHRARREWFHPHPRIIERFAELRTKWGPWADDPSIEIDGGVRSFHARSEHARVAAVVLEHAVHLLERIGWNHHASLDPVLARNIDRLSALRVSRERGAA